jgi:hypothetical protein
MVLEAILDGFQIPVTSKARCNGSSTMLLNSISVETERVRVQSTKANLIDSRFGNEDNVLANASAPWLPSLLPPKLI